MGKVVTKYLLYRKYYINGKAYTNKGYPLIYLSLEYALEGYENLKLGLDEDSEVLIVKKVEETLYSTKK